MSESAPAPFKQSEWVEYTRYQTNAAIIAVLGLGMAAFALSQTDSPLVAFPAAMVAGLYGPKALDSWDAAKRVRQSAEARYIGGVAFMAIVGTTILKALQNATEENA